jgi:hypothetical protein
MTITQIFIPSLIYGCFTTLSVYQAVHFWRDGRVSGGLCIGKDLETNGCCLTEISWQLFGRTKENHKTV